MDIRKNEIFKVLDPNRIWIPIILGLGIVLVVFYFDSNVSSENLPLIVDAKIGGLILAAIVLIARDAGYAYRMRAITNKELTWKSSIVVIILWEFASAVTPSVVGGTAVAVFILSIEGLNFGKSMAYVMLTAILDNMFFVLSAPLVLLLTQGEIFPNVKIDTELQYLFYLSYALIAIYTTLMSYALFAKPRAFKWLLLRLTNLKWLKRWRSKANQYGDEIIIASKELKGKVFRYWLRISLATIFIWCARYLMVNSLMSSYHDGLTFIDHMVIFSRQIIMWVVMLISPTPGASGVAEYSFSPFFREYLGEYTFVTGILWRMMTYYPYLILGAIFLPRWIRKNFVAKKKILLTN